MALLQWRRDEEAKAKEDWERMRVLATILLSPHAKKGHTIKPKDVLVFPWEEKAKKKRMKPLSPEERAKRFGDWDKYAKKKWQASQT